MRILIWTALTTLVTAGFLVQVTHHEPRQWPEPALLDLEFEGARYRLNHDQLTHLERFSMEWLEAGDEQVQAHWMQHIEAELDARFDTLHARVPTVVDAWFSLGAEYHRLWLRGLHWLGQADPDAAFRILHDQLLPESLWEHPIQALAERTEWGLDEDQRKVRDAWRVALTRELAPARTPAVPPALQSPREHHARVERARTLAMALDTDFTRLDQRTGLATAVAAGAGPATPLIARAVQARMAAHATRGGRAAFARTGAFGTGLCVWSGPAALGCGLVMAGAAWIGTDWILLQLDETLHRDDMETALHEALNILQEETQQTLQQAIEGHVEDRHVASRESIRNTFQPWRAALETSDQHP